VSLYLLDATYRIFILVSFSCRNFSTLFDISGGR